MLKLKLGRPHSEIRAFQYSRICAENRIKIMSLILVLVWGSSTFRRALTGDLRAGSNRPGPGFWSLSGLVLLNRLRRRQANRQFAQGNENGISDAQHAVARFANLFDMACSFQEFLEQDGDLSPRKMSTQAEMRTATAE